MSCAATDGARAVRGKRPDSAGGRGAGFAEHSAAKDEERRLKVSPGRRGAGFARSSKKAASSTMAKVFSGRRGAGFAEEHAA